MNLELSNPSPPYDPRAERMLPAVGGFPPSDREIFLSGYSELCKSDLNGATALEICGGFGQLAGLLAETFRRPR